MMIYRKVKNLPKANTTQETKHQFIIQFILDHP